jgi:hypothetical protein
LSSAERIAVRPARAAALLEFLSKEVAGEPYVLSDEERAIIEPAFADAKRGENVIDIEVLNLRKPWA